jgi:acyl-CoA reductase-like NAD-dependent aldehyde dehydrogenase
MTDTLPEATLLIGGDKVTGSGGSYEHFYPATGKPNTTIELAGPDDVDRAVASARVAQREWASLPPARRRDLLFGLADLVGAHFRELSLLNVADYGVPVSMAGNSFLTERYLRYYAGYADKAHGTSAPGAGPYDVNLIEREPYGVVAAILPWNGPLVPVGLNVAPALAAGNAVVIKPAELSPFAPMRFGELCLEAGLPVGLVNVIPAGPAGGEALVGHPGVAKVHFTGGDGTARKILATAARNLTPVATELGGKSANIVFADADLDLAAQLAARQGPFTQSGQNCSCGSRILVQDSIYDAFVEKFTAVIRQATIGDPLDPSVVFGPVVSQAAADRILGIIDRAVSERMGELIIGGKRLGGELAEGYYIEPTVFADVDNRSPLAVEETFGPVVSLMRFRDEDEAVALANDSLYGLNAFLQTRDLGRAHRVSRRLEAGSVWVNTFSDLSPQSPYGGYKRSGSGRAGGLEGLYEFLQVKNIRMAIS